MALTYLLPLRRREGDPEGDDLMAYVHGLARLVDEVLVVDGSPAHVYDRHSALLAGVATHITPDPRDRCANGKAWAVLTGLRCARHDAVVIADEDVRWDESTLTAVTEALQGNDLIVPANYFTPMRWHAAWDTGRILLNRAVAHDWPGTLGVRRSALAGSPRYDGDVLFENCELVRTVDAAGGTVDVRHDLLVARRPPTFAHFLRQRPRQAYDDLAEPERMAAMLAIVPLIIVARWRTRAAAAVLAIALAEAGRRKQGGRRVFPWYTALCAPAWLTERALLSWWALWLRAANRGVVYSGTRLHRAATPLSTLRRCRPRAREEPAAARASR